VITHTRGGWGAHFALSSIELAPGRTIRKSMATLGGNNFKQAAAHELIIGALTWRIHREFREGESRSERTPHARGDMAAASPRYRNPVRAAAGATVATVLCAALLRTDGPAGRTRNAGVRHASLAQVSLWDAPMNPGLCATQVNACRCARYPSQLPHAVFASVPLSRPVLSRPALSPPRSLPPPLFSLPHYLSLPAARMLHCVGGEAAGLHA